MSKNQPLARMLHTILPFEDDADRLSLVRGDVFVSGLRLVDNIVARVFALYGKDGIPKSE